MSPTFDRILAALAGLSGLAGIALSAAAAHLPGTGQLDIAARFLLIHAPALIGVAALARVGVVHADIGRIAGIVIALGLTMFAGDLVWRAWRGVGLAPMAAPAGGIGLMLGWALFTLAAVVGGRRV